MDDYLDLFKRWSPGLNGPSKADYYGDGELSNGWGAGFGDGKEGDGTGDGFSDSLKENIRFKYNG
jgi:hypothetical protein